MSDLKEDPQNPRAIEDDAFAGLGTSLEEFGDLSGITWNQRTGLLVSGHQRMRSLREAHGPALKMTDGAVVTPDGERFNVRVVDWPEGKARLANLAANSDKIMGSFTPLAVEQLSQMELSFPELSIDLKMDELRVDLEGQFKSTVQDGRTDPEDIPDPPKKAITKPGDLWILGDSRVLCGDSTQPKDVDRLMQRKQVQLLFTSPPYMQQREYEGGSGLSNWDSLMRGVFGHLKMTPKAQVLVNLGLVHKDGEWFPYWDRWIAWMRSRGWRRFGLYVWDQMHGLRASWNGRCAPSFEFIFHFNTNAVKPKKWIECKHAGGRGGSLRNPDGSMQENREKKIQPYKIPDSVWRLQRAKGGVKGHPAPFSVALVDFALRSWAGDLYDPFLGSGTSVVAAEQLGRRCFGMEIEPKYVDVAVERWENFTGKKAKRKKKGG